MKKIFFILLLFVGSGLQAQEIKWMSLPEALEAQKTRTQENIYGCLHPVVWSL